ncbi:MAG: hypothetical protein JNK05_36010 [Myxococcales bacterium]|nr:hypothetical protein [Myxococcales bacterium]
MSDQSKGTESRLIWGIVVVGAMFSIAISVVTAVFVYNRLREEALLQAVPTHPSLSRQDRLRVARTIDSLVAEFGHDPTLDAQLTRAAGFAVYDTATRNRAGQLLGARGVTTLNAAQLDEVFAVKLALARSSPSLCAAMWNGGADQGEIYAGLARLPDAQLHRWMALTVTGMRAALRPGFALPPEDAEAVSLVVAHAAERLDGERRTRFQSVAARGVGAPPAEACATWIDLLDAARREEPVLRARFYRAIARP